MKNHHGKLYLKSDIDVNLISKKLNSFFEDRKIKTKVYGTGGIKDPIFLDYNLFLDKFSKGNGIDLDLPFHLSIYFSKKGSTRYQFYDTVDFYSGDARLFDRDIESEKLLDQFSEFIVELFQVLSEFVDYGYAYGEAQWGEHFGPSDFFDCMTFLWLSYWSDEKLDLLGKELVLEAPFWKKIEWENGYLLVNSKSPFTTNFKQECSKGTYEYFVKKSVTIKPFPYRVKKKWWPF